MIIVKISGGLGNQLFQYSFGKFISLKLKTNLKLDLHHYTTKSNCNNRRFELAEFNLTCIAAEPTEIKELKCFTSGIPERIERILVKNLPMVNKNYYVEQPLKLIAKKDIRDNCYYDGYFQSTYYLKDITEVLRNELQFTLPKTNEQLKLITEAEESVSIHIRRGDYLLKSSYKVCALNYYENAVAYLKQRLNRPSFFVFSDDLEWARAHLGDKSFVFMDSDENEPIVDLQLMSSCRHQIIANSTFSWWAAWLNNYRSKIVVAPKSWMRDPDVDALTMSRILPNEWIKI